MSTQTATILVTDLVGSTELRVRLGEEHADALREVHDSLLSAAVTDHGGSVVKGLGDGVLALFPSAADAVSAGVAAQQATHAHARRHPDEPLSIRVGISVGDVTRDDDGDCFGTPVIEAARLCAAAVGGQILAADLVEALARGRGGHEYAPAGELGLKGLPEPVRAVEVRWAPASSGPGAQPPFPSLLSDERSVSFVGRPEQLDALEVLWKQAATGQRRCALLAGEPGIGKTRLAAEVARRAHDQGATVLLGRCEEELGLPFQPFVEAVAAYVAAAAPTADDLGRHPADLARLYPELADLVPGLGEPLKGDADLERHRLFEATTSWLAAASEPAGLVLVLDDLHWAGKPTLLLLRHLLPSAAADGARLLVLGTYRDTDLDRTHPLGELLADLRREPGVERVPLGGFTVAEVEEFLVAASGEDLDDAKRLLAAAVHAETEGNAFFVGEVLRHLAESGAIVQVDGVWQAAVSLDDMAIPEGVREVIGRRVSRLSDQVNDVLRWGAVIGRDLDFAVLRAVVDATEDDVLTALDEAIDARLVEETGAGRYRFVHALVRSTLLDEVRTTRRVRMHLRIAEVLEARDPDDVAALAHHFAEAASAGAEDKAVTYTERAGRQAMARSAHDEAVTLFRQALELLDDAGLAGSEDDARRLDLLIDLGRAEYAVGGGGHEVPLAEAVGLARSLGDGERMAEALLAGHRGFASVAFAVNEPLVADIADALTMLGAEDSTARSRLLSLQAVESQYAGPALAILDEAQAMARRLGDDRCLVESLGAQGNLALEPFPLRWGPAVVDEGEAVADRIGDATLRVGWQAVRAQLALEAGELDRAERILDDWGIEVERLGSVVLRWTLAFQEAGLRLYRGDHDEAEPLIEEAFALGQQAGQPDAFQYYGCQLLFLRRQQGRGEEIIDLLREWIEPRPPGHEFWQAALALLLVECDRHDEARDRFAEGLSVYPREHFDFATVIHGVTLAHIAAELDDRDAAAMILEELTPFRGTMAHWRPLASLGPVDLATGRLLLTLDRPEEALEHLVASAEWCERSGLRPFLAQSRLIQGGVAQARGDDAAARGFWTDALAQAEARGFGTTERRARAALARLDGPGG